jgi:uncharacterized protein (TIGR02270 family)
MKNNQRAKERVAITGMGMVSSAGLTAPGSVLAILAGMSDFRSHKRVMLEAQDKTSLRGATVARISGEFIDPTLDGADRALAMLLPAVKEAVFGVKPELLEKAYCRIESAADPDIMRHLAAKLPQLPPNGGHQPQKGLGRCRAFENVIQAVEDLRQGKHQMALVGFADSLADDNTLTALARAGRLLGGTNPEGIVAGELAGAVLLETESHARKRNARIYACISGWGKGTEPNPWTGPNASRAEGLTDAFLEALGKSGRKEAEIAMIINDLNGQRSRALEWGLTQSRVFPSGNHNLVHPADCLGDCGAASAMALLVLAAGIMALKWRPPQFIALSASDDAGARRCLILEKGDSIHREEMEGFYKRQYRLENSAECPSIETITDSCVFDALFLIRQRARATRAADYSLNELLRFDERLDAGIEGLKMAGGNGWEASLKNLHLGETALFAPAVLAFTSGRREWIEKVIEKAEESQDQARPVLSALGWIGRETAMPHVQALLQSKNPVHQRIAIAAGAILRVDIGEKLTDAFFSPEPFVKARALRMAGELGRKDCLLQLQGSLRDSDEGCRFWAAWSLALLGDKKSSSGVLAEFAEKGGPYSERAADMAARIMNPASVVSLHKNLAGSEKTARLAIEITGAFGDPVLMPWIIEQMSNPAPARLAGDAFTTVTGVDVAESNLEGKQPDGFSSGPTDDPADKNVKMAPDEFLAWPDHGRVKSWWDGNRNSFKNGVRYLMGQPIHAESLKQILMTGNQRIRHAASLEMSLLNPGRPLFNASAPAWRQLDEIEKM